MNVKEIWLLYKRRGKFEKYTEYAVSSWGPSFFFFARSVALWKKKKRAGKDFEQPLVPRAFLICFFFSTLRETLVKTRRKTNLPLVPAFKLNETFDFHDETFSLQLQTPRCNYAYSKPHIHIHTCFIKVIWTLYYEKFLHIFYVHYNL